MKTGKYAVSANWGIYNHMIRTDLSSYSEAADVAFRYKDKQSRVRAKRAGKSKGPSPRVTIWQARITI